MSIRLNSYRPLCVNEHGRRAIEMYNLPPFIDSSCRRDPDLQNPYPSTTSLCRGENFAPHLTVGDTIVYMTRSGVYEPFTSGNRVLTAILKVVEIYPDHSTAASWYREHDVPLPNNCIVPGNPPFSWDETAGVNSKDFTNVPEWDAFYQARSRRIPVFVRTEKMFCELHQPPVLSNNMLIDIFGRIPRTQTPPTITQAQFDKVLKLTGITL